MYPLYYTKEEKQLFINHMIYKKDNYQQEFQTYLAQLKNLQHNTHHVLWGNKNNDNLLTFIFSQPDFQCTYSILQDLKKIHLNWDHKDNNGNTTLHLLAIKSEKDLITRITNDFSINTNIKNKNDDYFTFLLLNPNPTFLNKDLLNNEPIYFLTYIHTIYKLFLEHPQHFECSSKTKIQQIATNYNKLKTSIELQLKTIPNYEKEIKEHYLNLTQPMDSFINHFVLEKEVFNTHKKTTKTKI